MSIAQPSDSGSAEPRQFADLLFIDAVLILGVAILLAPLWFSLQATPFTHDLPNGAIAGIGLGTLLLGIIVLALPGIPTRWRSVLTMPAIVIAGLIGAAIIWKLSGRSQDFTILVAVGSFTAALSMAMLWFIVQSAQPWLALAVYWMMIAGLWQGKLSALQLWEISWMLLLSLLLAGLSHLRDELLLWKTQHLKRLGAVIWPTARIVATIAVLTSIIVVVPVGATRVPQLSQWLRHSPLAATGLLDYIDPQGTPVAVLGAPLALSGPIVGSKTIVATYTVSTDLVTPDVLPLIGATYDIYNQQTWTEGPTSTQHVAAKTLPASTVTATITMYAGPRQTGNLLGFSQPVQFSIPVTRRVLTNSGAPSLLTVASWETTPFNDHMTYTVQSTTIPDSATATETASSAFMQHMTIVPDSLRDRLYTLAHTWVGNATTPAAQADALYTGMHQAFTVDESSKPPKGTDPIAWFLDHKVGNGLLWTTAYILLGRSIGLPLRLASGYLPGTLDTSRHAYVVRGSDATVWAQLAVPGVGWRDLFPSSDTLTVVINAQPIVHISPTPTPVTTPNPGTQSSKNPDSQQTPFYGGTGTLVTLLLILALLCIVLALGAFVVVRRWATFGQNLPPLVQVFARISFVARLAGIELRSSDSSSDATERIVTYVPPQADTLWLLNAAYERQRYGPPRTGETLAFNIKEMWKRMSDAFWRLVWTRPMRFGKKIVSHMHNERG